MSDCALNWQQPHLKQNSIYLWVNWYSLLELRATRSQAKKRLFSFCWSNWQLRNPATHEQMHTVLSNYFQSTVAQYTLFTITCNFLTRFYKIFKKSKNVKAQRQSPCQWKFFLCHPSGEVEINGWCVDALQGSRSTQDKENSLSASLCGEYETPSCCFCALSSYLLVMVQTLGALGCEETTLIYILFTG